MTATFRISRNYSQNRTDDKLTPSQTVLVWNDDESAWVGNDIKIESLKQRDQRKGYEKEGL